MDQNVSQASFECYFSSHAWRTPQRHRVGFHVYWGLHSSRSMATCHWEPCEIARRLLRSTDCGSIALNQITCRKLMDSPERAPVSYINPWLEIVFGKTGRNLRTKSLCCRARLWPKPETESSTIRLVAGRDSSTVPAHVSMSPPTPHIPKMPHVIDSRPLDVTWKYRTSARFAHASHAGHRFRPMQFPPSASRHTMRLDSKLWESSSRSISRQSS